MVFDDPQFFYGLQVNSVHMNFDDPEEFDDPHVFDDPQGIKLEVREPVKHVLAILSVKGVPPPHPLNGQSFCQKTLKMSKNDVFVLNKVTNGPKRPYHRPKRAKNV